MPESTDVEAAGRPIVVYDGQCPLCSASVRFVVRHRLLEEDRCRPWQSFAGAEAERLAAQGIRNEAVAMDPVTGELRPGAPGLLWALRGGRVGFFARCLDRPLARPFVSAAYRLISVNRRILSPPAVSPPDRRPIECACEPDDRPSLRWTLVALLLAFALFVVAAFGAVFARELGHLPLVGTRLSILLVILPGWLVPALASLALRPPTRSLYLAHLSVTAGAGAAVLLPAVALAILLPAMLARGVLVLAVAIACALMLGMQERRTGYLGLSRRWVLLWLGSLLLATPAMARWLYAH